MISPNEGASILTQLFKGVFSLLILGWVLFFVAVALLLAGVGAWVLG